MKNQIPPSTTRWEAEVPTSTVREPVRPMSTGPTRATLTVLTGLDAGRMVSVDGDAMVIGSAAEADLRVDDAALSRRHARVARGPDGAPFIEDLGSTNGTFVGSRRVERAPLAQGDLVQLGPSLLMRFAVLSEADAALQRRLYEDAVQDPLTGAFNRRYLLRHLASEGARALHANRAFSLLLMDVDRFKRLNDTCGHVAGDQALCLAVSRIAARLRTQDLVARYGGDELVVLVSGAAHTEAAALAERLRRDIEDARLPIAGIEASFTVSIGVASSEELEPTDDPSALLALADARLYEAKTQGRNQVRACGPAPRLRPEVD